MIFLDTIVVQAKRDEKLIVDTVKPIKWRFR